MDKGGSVSVLEPCLHLPHHQPSLQEEIPAACGYPRAWEPSRAPQAELHHVVLIRARKKLRYQNKEHFRAGLAGAEKSQASFIPECIPGIPLP